METEIIALLYKKAHQGTKYNKDNQHHFKLESKNAKKTDPTNHWSQHTSLNVSGKKDLS